MNNLAKPCALVLAAGLGRRYQAEAGAGTDKLLASCAGLDGVERAIFEQVLVNLGASGLRRLVVTRPHRAGIVTLAQAHGCEVVLLESAGMGDSLAAGVQASGDASGWLICLGDMPFILPATYTAIAAAVTDERICVPTGRDGYGHPVAFGRAFRRQLQALSGDQGARKLLAPQVLDEIPSNDPGIYQDVDQPADLIHQPLQ